MKNRYFAEKLSAHRLFERAYNLEAFYFVNAIFWCTLGFAAVRKCPKWKKLNYYRYCPSLCPAPPPWLL